MEAFFSPPRQAGSPRGPFPTFPSSFFPQPCVSPLCRLPALTPGDPIAGGEGTGGTGTSLLPHCPPTTQRMRSPPPYPTLAQRPPKAPHILGPSVRSLFLQTPSPVSPFLPPHCAPHSHRDPFARPSIPTALPGQGRSHRRVCERRLTAPEIKPLSGWPGFLEMWSRALLAGNLLGFPPPALQLGDSPPPAALDGAVPMPSAHKRGLATPKIDEPKAKHRNGLEQREPRPWGGIHCNSWGEKAKFRTLQGPSPLCQGLLPWAHRVPKPNGSDGPKNGVLSPKINA